MILSDSTSTAEDINILTHFCHLKPHCCGDSREMSLTQIGKI
jgi:hypothetical protein